MYPKRKYQGLTVFSLATGLVVGSLWIPANIQWRMVWVLIGARLVEAVWDNWLRAIWRAGTGR